jgi:WD40 repeat protein
MPRACDLRTAVPRSAQDRSQTTTDRAEDEVPNLDALQLPDTDDAYSLDRSAATVEATRGSRWGAEASHIAKVLEFTANQSSEREGAMRRQSLTSWGSKWALLTLSIVCLFAGACWAEIAYVGAFGSGLALYVVDESQATTRLVTTGPVDTAPAWSPDGARIAFARWIGDAPDIFVVNADGTHLVRLTDNPGQDFGPSWSPDGALIAFLSERDGTLSVYVMDADGANQRPFPGLPEGVSSLDWSPSGDRIVFDRIVDYEYKLFILDVLTGEVRELVGASGSKPRWSPDGQWIAFAGEAQIGIVHPDGSGLRWLTTQAGRSAHPTWSPDGMRVAYQSDDLGRDMICIVSVTTGTFVRVADVGTSPDWSPRR